MRRFTLAILVIFVAASVIAVALYNITTPTAAGNASHIVERAVIAPSKHTYSASGKTKFRYCGKLVTSDIEVFHKRPNKCRMEYSTPPLKGVVVGLDGESVWRFDPKLGTIFTMGSGSCSNLQSRLDLLLDNYRIERTGTAYIAKRPVYTLVVRSKSGEIRKRLWVDRNTYIVLRSEDYDARGKLQSATEYVSIKYSDDIPDSLFKRPANVPHDIDRDQVSSGPMSPDRLSRLVGFQVKSPRYVPKGYELDGYRMYECPCRCGHKSAYIRYTNGLNSISIFETLENSGCAREGTCKSHGQFGEACIIRNDGHGQTAMLSFGGKLFIVIADIDRKELRKIADSLK